MPIKQVLFKGDHSDGVQAGAADGAGQAGGARGG